MHRVDSRCQRDFQRYVKMAPLMSRRSSALAFVGFLALGTLAPRAGAVEPPDYVRAFHRGDYPGAKALVGFTAGALAQQENDRLLAREEQEANAASIGQEEPDPRQ